mmetsp:Transcript_35426/g.85570  ORF Transcript_35426/g.85570 Transcript_35426/m.85570 type:complete len:355 (-) Transcript_35426:92-1156(-)
MPRPTQMPGRCRWRCALSCQTRTPTASRRTKARWRSTRRWLRAAASLVLLTSSGRWTSTPLLRSFRLGLAAGRALCGGWSRVRRSTTFFDRGGGMSPVVANTLNIRSEPPTKIKGGVVYIKTALCEKVLGESLLPLAQLHERGIIHRDLKPRNIMLSERTPNTPLCIIDFGSAVTKGNRPFMNDYTEVYAPPEAPVPDGGNPFSYDIFTLGIVGLRVLMPSLIAGENGIATLGKVCVAEIPSYNYDIKAWASARANDPGGQFEFRALNKECEGLMQQPVLLELLSRMLSPNPRERPSAEECLRMLGPQWEAKLAQAKQGQQSRGNCGTCGQPVLSTDVGRFRDARGVYFHQQCQ